MSGSHHPVISGDHLSCRECGGIVVLIHADDIEPVIGRMGCVACDYAEPATPEGAALVMEHIATAHKKVEVETMTHLTTVTIETPEQARDFLLAAEVVGPSLHPRTRANGGVPGSWGSDGEWNGWNYATTAGRDADGVPVMLRSVHYASGSINFNGGPVGETPRGGSLEFAFSGIAFPVEVLPVTRYILHPEYTPEPVLCPECTQGKHDNCTEDVLTDNEVWAVCGCVCQRRERNFDG